MNPQEFVDRIAKSNPWISRKVKGIVHDKTCKFCGSTVVGNVRTALWPHEKDCVFLLAKGVSKSRP